MAIGLLLRRVHRLLIEGRDTHIPGAATELLAAVDRNEFQGFFEQLQYERRLHLEALRLPVLHLLSSAWAPVFRRLLDTLLEHCDVDPSTKEHRAGEKALEFLLAAAEKQGDPLLARYPQVVENYFVCYIFSGIFPMLYHARGLSLEENAILLAEQYALLRILLAILPPEVGETEERRLTRAVVALARMAQHSDLGGAIRALTGTTGLDRLTHTAYLLR